MSQIIDLDLGTNIDMQIAKGRDLESTLHCVILSGETEIDFPFSSYTGATLIVKDSKTTILELTTENGMLEFGNDGYLTIKLTNEESNVRFGEYKYNLYLSNMDVTKRQLFYGNFIILNTI
jgi:hypothetical protein